MEQNNIINNIASTSLVASFLKLWLATRITDKSKHNYYDHQNPFNRIHSLLVVFMHLI